MFTRQCRPLLTRAVGGGGLLLSIIYISYINNNNVSTTMKTTVAHCQDAEKSKRRNNSDSGSGGEYTNDAVPLILTKYTHNKRSDITVDINEEDDKLTRQGFHRSDFDIYLTNPTKEDLLPLLNEYTVNNKNVWPWIWTWHNPNGPHYIFVGTNTAMNNRIVELANDSPRNNIIVITNNNENDGSSTGSSSSNHVLTKDISFYYTNRCGIIDNVTIQEIDIINKIILLSDERILCFTELYIV
jgi:hypothetical protein